VSEHTPTKYSGEYGESRLLTYLGTIRNDEVPVYLSNVPGSRAWHHRHRNRWTVGGAGPIRGDEHG
jgi:hypothetical protein